MNWKITLWVPLFVTLLLWWTLGGAAIPVHILFVIFLVTPLFGGFVDLSLAGKVARINELPWDVHYVVHSNFTIGNVNITALRQVEPNTGELRFVALSLPPPVGTVVRRAWRGPIFRLQFYLKTVQPL